MVDVRQRYGFPTTVETKNFRYVSAARRFD
jgi:hypothetical protein